MTAHFSDEQRAEIKALFREEMKDAVHAAINDYFKGYGSSTVTFVIQMAAFLVALSTIIYTLRTIAGWFGILITRG